MQISGMQNQIIRTFTAALACVIDDSKAIYMSTPITNGLLVVDTVTKNPVLLQLSERDFWKFIQDDIIPANNTKAQIFAKKLRSKGLGIIIDPSRFFDDNLTQNEYLHTWESVILQFANAIWFNEGWEFSNGCATEYCIALENKIPTFDNRGNQLPVEKAVAQVTTAVDQIKAAGLSIDNHEKTLKRMHSFDSTTNTHPVK